MSRVTIYIFATSNIAEKLQNNYTGSASDAKEREKPSLKLTRLDTNNLTADPSTTTNATNTATDATATPWWAWPVVDVDTDATAVIYLSPRDNPARSPSLAPGQVLPKVRRGGTRAEAGKKKHGNIGHRARLSAKKGDRYQALVRSMLRDQARDPTRHPREYVVDVRNPVFPVPAPTCFSNYTGPDRQQYPGGMIMRYRVVDTPYFPVVTTTAPTSAITTALFGSGKCFTYAPLFAATDEPNQKGNLSRTIR